MLRPVGFLLVMLPLLMPPGMCICQFAHAGEAAPPGTDIGCEDDGPTCCPHPESDGHSHPGVPHDPGCPAAKATELSKITEPVPTASTLVGEPAVLPATGLTAAPVRVTRPTDAPPGPSRPIYVHFCTLLI